MRHICRIIWVGLFWLGEVVSSSAIDGLITRPSNHSLAETLDRFEKAATARGYVIFAKLDHAAAARAVGHKMRGSTVLVFGNPRVGTDYFLQHPTLAIDLPMKALVWEGSDGKVAISYNTAHYLFNTIFARHAVQLTPDMTAQLEKTNERLAGVVDDAIR